MPSQRGERGGRGEPAHGSVGGAGGVGGRGGHGSQTGGVGGRGGQGGSGSPGEDFGGGILRNPPTKFRMWLLGLAVAAAAVAGGWVYTSTFQAKDTRIEAAADEAHSAAMKAQRLAEQAEVLAERAFRSARALCALRRDVKNRLEISRGFLRDNPQSELAPAVEISVKNQENTLKALSVMVCPAPRPPPGFGLPEGGDRQNPSQGQLPGGSGPPFTPPLPSSPPPGGGNGGGGGNGNGGNGNGGGGPGPGPGPEQPDSDVSICIEQPLLPRCTELNLP